MKILLDPGHGAGSVHNRGFVKVPGWNYSNEGDTTFIYCKDYLKPALEEYEDTIVDMTRVNIKDNPTLTKRGNMGKGYDLFISDHTNGGGGKAYGVEAWDDCNPNFANPKLAKSIVDSIWKVLYKGNPLFKEEEIKKANRGVKYSRYEGNPKQGTTYSTAPGRPNFYTVLNQGMAKSNMIIEKAFHDNYKDITNFIDKMKAVAEATAKAIANHYGLKKKGETAGVKPPIAVEPEKPVEDSYYKYYEVNNLMILETKPENIYTQYIGGKTLHQVGAIGINGGFFSGNVSTPNSICSIMVNNGKIIGPNAYTNEYNHPDIKRGTMVFYEDGQVAVQYINNINELTKPYRVVIGGVALWPSYDMKYEKAPSNWLRKTNHSGIAYAGGMMHLIVSENCTMDEFRNRIIKTFGDKLVSAIAVDGGGSTQMFAPNGGMKSSDDRRIPSIIGIKKG